MRVDSTGRRAGNRFAIWAPLPIFLFLGWGIGGCDGADTPGSYKGLPLRLTTRGEPLSCEEGHALNLWLAENAEVGGVWHGWGPYLWAPSCASGGFNGAGICYDREDYVGDGVDPSAEGRSKIAALIHARMMRESWYRR